MQRLTTLLARGFVLGLLGFGAVSLSGCGVKLNVEEDFEMIDSEKRYVVEPIKKEQMIKVTASATGAPIGVFVFLEKDDAAASREIFAGKFTNIVLAKTEKTEQAALEAKIPANQSAIVMVTRAGARRRASS